jgi:NAD(P)H-flavin reductase
MRFNQPTQENEMKVKAEDVGSAPYLTAGKEYVVVGGPCGNAVPIKDDDGDLIYITIEGCAHIDHNKWTVTED